MSTDQVFAYLSAPGCPDLVLSGAIAINAAPAPTGPPDLTAKLGFQGLVKGVAKQLANYTGDVTNGGDISGKNIAGAVICRTDGITGDGFKIVGAPGGTKGDALLDFNHHFTARPIFQHFTIDPDVTVQSVNGWMGGEASLYDFYVADVGGDAMSPNNLATKLPLNLDVDLGLCHNQVYYLKDSHPDGTHNDSCQLPGGTGGKITRVYMTGITHPTRGDGAALRTKGPTAGSSTLPGPRPLGQQNSALMVTQNVSAVKGLLIDRCRLGGGWYATVNMTAGDITITNSEFDGNSLYGLDIAVNKGATLTQSGNTRADGKPLKIKLNN